MITPMTKVWETELLWSEEELTKKSKMKNEGGGLLILGIGALALGVLNHLLLHIIYESDMISSYHRLCTSGHRPNRIRHKTNNQNRRLRCRDDRQRQRLQYRRNYGILRGMP